MTGLLKRLRLELRKGKEIAVELKPIPDKLTHTQESFIIWNSKRTGITIQESRNRYLNSWCAVPGGHSGSAYRAFNELNYKLFQVIYNDDENNVYAAYQYYGLMHFLRMLSYPEPEWAESDHVVEHLRTYSEIDILDFGCGLAQTSRSLARFLLRRGAKVTLTLVDIPTIRKEFLIWLGAEAGIQTRFLECTESVPIPELPKSDICIATEFFEHVHDPIRYFDAIHGSLRENGLLVTDVSDHEQEFMHVSPKLQALRAKIDASRYESLRKDQIFRKRAAVAG